MGTVYKAVHVSLGAPRALKVMRRELAGDPGLAARFRAEARLAEGLRHPHLVALFDFGALPDGGWYIVSELVEGATLAALLRRRGTRFSAADVVVFGGQIADGLAVAHRKGIVHRDISPDNIMLADGGEGTVVAKLLDFGIAKQTHRPPSEAATGQGWSMGKIGFSSPEQMGALAEGEVVDGRCDVFSLAAITYLMLTGRLPWRKDSVQAYAHDLLVRPDEELGAEVRAYAPPPWEELFLPALARSRERRLPHMTALKDGLLEMARRCAVAADVPDFPADQLRAGGRGGDSPLPTRTLHSAAATSSPSPDPAFEQQPLDAPLGLESRGLRTPVSLAAAATRDSVPATSLPGPVLTPSAAWLQDLSRLESRAAVAQDPEPFRPTAREEGRTWKVVLLDDDANLRPLLPALIEGPDLAVAAASWHGAPSFTASERPDLVLADVGADAEAGRSRVEALRGHPGLATVPIVLFAAANDWTLRGLARVCGARGYLSKSALGGNLGAEVRRFLSPVPDPVGTVAPSAPAFPPSTSR